MRLRTLAMAMLVAGCGESEPEGPGSVDSGTPPTPFDCTLYLSDGRGGFWTPAENDHAELVLGFQGLLFIRVRIGAGPDAPTRADARGSVVLDDQAPHGGTQPDTPISADGRGGLISDDVLLFLNPAEVNRFKDRRARIALRLDAEGRTCTGSAEVLLVDEDPCIDASDEPICPDAGVTP